jgi:hypothetical protein
MFEDILRQIDRYFALEDQDISKEEWAQLIREDRNRS